MESEGVLWAIRQKQQNMYNFVIAWEMVNKSQENFCFFGAAETMIQGTHVGYRDKPLSVAGNKLDKYFSHNFHSK